jgi:hypothetical protein
MLRKVSSARVLQSMETRALFLYGHGDEESAQERRVQP